METPNPSRRTLALLFCDMVGTSRLMADEGDLVVSAMLRYVLEHVGDLGNKHDCLVMKFIGDGFLAAFDNPAEVVPFAFSVQHILANVPLPVGKRAAFRFSIHVGDAVYIETSYGKEVLMAARIRAGREPIDDLLPPSK